MKASSAYRDQIDRALAWIDARYARRIDFDAAAQESGLSRFHFQRVFKAVTGETPAEYLRRIRLESAMRKVVERPDLALTDIALDQGFSSQSLFSRSFREYFGMSPRWFRKSGRFAKDGACVREPRADRAAIEPALLPMPGRSVAYVRANGYSASIGSAYKRLFALAGAAGLLGEGAKTLGIPLDNPEVTQPRDCRYLAAVSLPDGAGDIQPPLGSMSIPGSLTAVLRYSGPESGIQAAYASLYADWLIGSPYLPLDFPAYQVVLRNPWRHGGGDYELEICLPLKKQ